VPGSRSWGSACKRVVTWGKFRDRKSGRVFFHFNTHFDHISGKARRMSAQLLVERIGAIAGDIPVVATGDFNAIDTSTPYQTMTSLLLDSRVISLTPPLGPCGTSRGFALDSQPGRRIDYIFISKGMAIKNYAVIENTYKNGRRPSDHMPVLADMTIPNHLD
jgi:endonuclease/exonuclease/phosphatase family metal-dependent hydrolase